MGEITGTVSLPKSYYRIEGKDKCIYKKIKGGGQEKVGGLKGYLQDIILRKSKLPNDKDIHYQWHFVLTDKIDPDDEDMRYILYIKEGSYASERLANILAGVSFGGEITISVYESSKIKNSPGISIKIDGKSAEFAYSSWNGNGYDGVPEGTPKDEVRIDFWRDVLFGKVYTTFLNKDWDGTIEIDYSLRDDEDKYTKKEEEYSDKMLLACNKVLSQAEKLSDKEILKKWSNMVSYMKNNIEKSIDHNLLDKTCTSVQLIFDTKSNECYQLFVDGSYEESDLPF